MIKEIFEAVQAKWDQTPGLAERSRLYVGEVPADDDSFPRATIRQLEGGETGKTTCPPHFESVLLQFVGVAVGLDQASEFAEEIVRGFDKAELLLEGQPFMMFDRAAPEFVDEIEDGDDLWELRVGYDAMVNRNLTAREA